VLTYVFGIIAAAGVLAVLFYCLAAGLRNGDRPGDALVTALLRTAAQPDEPRPLVIAAVGQEGGRLRVHRLRLGPVRHAGEGKLEILSPALRS